MGEIARIVFGTLLLFIVNVLLGYIITIIVNNNINSLGLNILMGIVVAIIIGFDIIVIKWYIKKLRYARKDKR